MHSKKLKDILLHLRICNFQTWNVHPIVGFRAKIHFIRICVLCKQESLLRPKDQAGLFNSVTRTSTLMESAGLLEGHGSKVFAPLTPRRVPGLGPAPVR